MNEESRPYMGTIVVTRSYGNGACLFRSAVPNHSTVCIEIHEASVQSTNGGEFVMPGKTIILVRLSPLQWAEVVSSIGMGAGTPCTIERRGERLITGPTFTQFDQTSARAMDNLDATLQTALESAKRLRSRVLDASRRKTGDNRQLLEEVFELLQSLDSVEFGAEQWHRYLDQAATEAIAAAEANLAHRVQQAGLSSVKELPTKETP